MKLIKGNETILVEELKQMSEKMFQKDELLDIVNEDDEVIDVLPRSIAYQRQILFSLRAIWFFIKNKDGKFWIPRRVGTKKILPHYLDGSAVGHVSSGETYEESLIREVQEELCVDITYLPYTYVGKLTPKDGAICFINIFELIVPNDFIIDYNQNDFSEFFWLSAQEIIQKNQEGELMKDTLPLIMKRFYCKI